MPTIGVASALIGASYKATTGSNGQPLQSSSLPTGWTLAKVYNDTGTGGDYAAVYVNPADEEVFIAGRGTSTSADYGPDAGIGLQQLPTSRISDATSIYQSIQSQYAGYDVFAGGHSLDGLVWAGVGQNQPSLSVLALDAPDTYFANNPANSNVLAISESYDLVGHLGNSFSNYINVNDGASVFNQWGAGGTHSESTLTNFIINNMPTLSNTEMSSSYANNIGTGALTSNVTSSHFSENSASNTSNGQAINDTINSNGTVTGTATNANPQDADDQTGDTASITSNSSGVGTGITKNSSGTEIEGATLSNNANGPTSSITGFTNSGGQQYTDVNSESSSGQVNATITGNDQSFNMSSAIISVAANATLNLTGSNNGTTLGKASQLFDSGGGGSISAVSGDELTISNTNLNPINITGTNIANADKTYNGQAGGIFIGSNSQVNLNVSGSDFIVGAGSSVFANGSANAANAATGSLLEMGSTGGGISGIIANNDGVGTTANGQGTGLVFLANAFVAVSGSNNHDTFDASGVNLTTSNNNIGIVAGLTSESLTGSNLVFDIGNSVTATIHGNNDIVHGSSADKLTFNGTDDVADVQNSVVNFQGSDTGDDVNGTGDSGSDWGGDSGSDGGEDGGYGGYGGYAFSKAPTTTGTNIGVIASFDADLTDQADADSAQTARLQAEAALSPTTTSSAHTPVFEGATWASKTLTWSIAGNPDANGAQLSGTIGSQYISLIQSAFQTWAAFSGLKFQQVTGSTPADINLGWSTFNNAASAVLGYTGFRAMNASILPGLQVSLENPSDDPLVTDSKGQLAYSGTQTELEQLILHEIGHALGLADNSDPNSIMNAVLTTANRTLDATDITGIKTLYEPATVAGATASAAAAVTTGLSDIASIASSNPITVASSLIGSLTQSVLSPFTTEADQLIGAMAAFAPTASPTTFMPPTLASVASGLTLAASGG